MIRYETKGGIGKIILDGSNHNPLNLDALVQLGEALEASQEKKDQCVLLVGSGANFSVGADLNYVQGLLDSDEEKGFANFSMAFQEVTRKMLAHSGIIVAGLHGWVIGGGFEITLSADLRYAEEGMKIRLPELKIGTMFSNGSTKLLGQLIGMGRAKELMFTDQDLGAVKAYEIGLVNKVCPKGTLENHMQAIAKTIVTQIDPKAQSMAKELIQTNVDRSIKEVLDAEYKALIELAKKKSFKQRIGQFRNN